MQAGDDDGFPADDELRNRRRAGLARIARETGGAAVVGAEFDPDGSDTAGRGGDGALTVAVDGGRIVDEDAVASGDAHVERVIGVVFVAKEDGRRFGGGGLWAGGGITFGIEETFRPWIERGDLVPLLQDFLPPFPGFFLYFPSRHHPPAKLRALNEHVRAFRDAGVPA